MTPWISWSFSCIVHLIFLIVLALVSLVHSVSPANQLSLVFETTDLSSQKEDRIFEFSASSAARPLISVAPSQSQATPTAVPQLSTDLLPSNQTEPKINLESPAVPAQELQAVLSNLATISNTIKGKTGGENPDSFDEASEGDESGNEGVGVDGTGRSMPAASRSKKPVIQYTSPRASFFGTEVTGKKFVFVVDSSRSMMGPRWQTATYELMRSLHELMTDTEFFVICFDETDHPLFDQVSTKKFLVNDPKTLDRAQDWIQRLILGRGTFPSSALAKAVKMAPDAIFLLSDGVIQDDSIWMLRQLNHDKKTGQPIIPIHTILLLSPMGRQPLEVIAAENGGSFKDITLEDILP